MQMDSSLYEDFLFSCVVDAQFKFQSQLYNLVASSSAWGACRDRKS